MRTLRTRRKGWTQARLAQEAGLSRNYIADIEAGRSANPGRQALRGLARALGVSLAELIEAEPTTEEAEEAGDDPQPQVPVALLRFVGGEFYSRKIERLAQASGLDPQETDRRVREVLRLLPQPPQGLTAADYRAVMHFLTALADA